MGDPRVASPTIYKGQRRLALQHRTGAKREGPEPVCHGSSDPMREAGAPNTRKLLLRFGQCARPREVDMFAPQTLLHNALIAQI